MASAANSLGHRRVRLGNVEPAAVALLKQLDPLIVILTLFACELAYRDTLHAFPGSVRHARLHPHRAIVQPDHIREFGHAFSDFSRTYDRVLLQWAAVVAMLLFAAFAFKVSAELSRRVVLTWFGVTPVAAVGCAHACAARALVRHQRRLSAPRHIIIGVNEVGFELARRMSANGLPGLF